MKKRTMSMAMALLMMFQCIPLVGATNGVTTAVSSFQLVDEFHSVVTESIYGGETEDVTYINTPTSGTQYLLVYLTATLSTGSTVDLDDMVVTVGGVSYRRITSDEFLTNHSFTPLRHGTTTVSSGGWTLFEVATGVTEAQLLAQGTLTVGGIETFFAMMEEEDEFLITQQSYYSYVDRQQELEASYLASAKGGNYTPENPYIIVNPYELAPLSALMIFQTEKAVSVTSIIYGTGTGLEYELTTITNTIQEETTWHEIPLIGLYQGENTVELVLSDGTSYTHQITTEEAPANLNNLGSTLIYQELEELSEGLYQLKDEYRTLWDVSGNLRGYISIPQEGSGIDYVTEDGHVFSSVASYTNYATVYEWDYMGYMYREIECYDWRVDHDGYYVDNTLIAKDHSYNFDTNAFENAIDWSEIFNSTQGSFQVRDAGSDDWLHLNTIDYGGDGYILVSMRNQHAVAKLSYPELEVQWVLSVNGETMVREEDQDKYLTPIGEEFEWFYSQHDVTLVSENEDGTIDITIFDNGAQRGLDGTSDDYPWDEMYSRMVRYRIDEEAMTVEQVWDWGEEYGVEGFASIRSSTQYLPQSDSYLGCFDGGNNGRTDEGNSSPVETLTTSKILEVNSDGEIIFGLELSDLAYRVDKFSTATLYSAFTGLASGEGEYLFASAADGATPYQDSLTLVDGALYQIHNLSATDQYLTISGWVAQPDVSKANSAIRLLLANEETGESYLYTLTANTSQAQLSTIPEEYAATLSLSNGFSQPRLDIQTLPDGDYSVTLVASVSGTHYSVETEYTLRIGDGPVESIPVTSTDLLEEQREISQQLMDTIDGGNYTITSPFVALDPYGTSPLSALVAFQTTEEGSVSVEIAGKTSATTVTHDFDEDGTTHLLPIYGLYGDTNNKVTITFTGVSGKISKKVVYIQTDALPENMVVADVTVANTSQMVDGFTYGIREGGGSYAIDANGDIRWYTTIEISTMPIKRLANGNIISGSSTLVEGESVAASLFEFDMLGRVYNEYLIYGVHHEVVELSNGDLLVAASVGDTVEDYIVRLDRTTGEIVQDWDFHDILDMEYLSDESWQYHIYNNQTLNNPTKTETAKWNTVYSRSANDWFHNNALYYNEEENTIMASGRMKDAIVKFDADTGEVIWILADPNVEWAQTTYADKMLTPIGEDFEYAYGQHAITMTDDGDILLFDNGNYRSKEYDTALTADETYSRAVRYSIDEETMTVEQVWQYGKELGSYAYSSYISDIDYLGEDHYLINFGGILGDMATGERYNASAFLNSDDVIDPQGITLIVEIKDDVIINQMELSAADGSANTYRVERMTPYYEGEGYVDLTMVGQRLGSLTPTETVEGMTLPYPTSTVDYTIKSIVDSGEDVYFDITVNNYSGSTQYIVLDNGTTQLIYGENSVVKYGLDYGDYEVGLLVVDATGNLHYTLLHQYITVEEQGFPAYHDVAVGSWYYSDVMAATAAGLFEGTGEATFTPDGSMTRAAMWTVLGREGEATFAQGDSWYSGAQLWAVESGVSDGTNPDGNVTREEFVTMLYRFYGEPEVEGDLTSFNDGDVVSDWAYDALVWATTVGIVGGTPEGDLNPQNSATRSEAAKMLMVYQRMG